MSEQDQPGTDLDEEVARAGRGLAQAVPVALSVLADQARRRDDAATTAAAAARAEHRQHEALALQDAQTGYLHATAPGWSSDASKDDLATTWVAAAPWCDRDPAAAQVTDAIEKRLERDWPQLADAYTHGRDQGLAPLDAMGSAVDHRLASSLAGDHALRQAGLHEERLAEQHLSTQDDPTTPLVDEKAEGIEDYVRDTERALNLQDQARPPAQTASVFPAPPQRPTEARPRHQLATSSSRRSSDQL